MEPGSWTKHEELHGMIKTFHTVGQTRDFCPHQIYLCQRPQGVLALNKGTVKWHWLYMTFFFYHKTLLRVNFPSRVQLFLGMSQFGQFWSHFADTKMDDHSKPGFPWCNKPPSNNKIGNLKGIRPMALNKWGFIIVSLSDDNLNFVHLQLRSLNTPWKINMEPTNHPIRKENHLPNLHDYVPC